MTSNAKPQFQRELTRRTATVVAQHLGRQVRFLDIERIDHARPQSVEHKHRDRAYMKVRLLDDSNVEMNVFVKQAPDKAVAAIDGPLSQIETKGFRPPYFFGSFNIDALRFGVWEFIDLIAHRTFASFESTDLSRIVNAIAAMNTLPIVTRLTSDQLGVREKLPWIETPQDWFDAKMEKHSRGQEWKELRHRTNAILQCRARLIERLNSIGTSFLSHNDLGARNIFVPPFPYDIIFIDWISACLTAPGVDLGFLHKMSTSARGELLKIYVSAANGRGARLKVRDVEFVSSIMPAFLLLQRGWKNGTPLKIVRGLELAKVALSN